VLLTVSDIASNISEKIFRIKSNKTKKNSKTEQTKKQIKNDLNTNLEHIDNVFLYQQVKKFPNRNGPNFLWKNQSKTIKQTTNNTKKICIFVYIHISLPAK
jgi:hypothetical protein